MLLEKTRQMAELDVEKDKETNDLPMRLGMKRLEVQQRKLKDVR